MFFTVVSPEEPSSIPTPVPGNSNIHSTRTYMPAKYPNTHNKINNKYLTLKCETIITKSGAREVAQWVERLVMQA